MFIIGLALWIGLTMRHAIRTRATTPGSPRMGEGVVDGPRLDARHALIMAIVLMPMAAYVYGALRLDWGLNELAAGFLAAGIVAGLVGRMGLGTTVHTYLEGMQSVLPAAFMVGVARSISLCSRTGASSTRFSTAWSRRLRTCPLSRPCC
jgi:hypothetical protein